MEKKNLLFYLSGNTNQDYDLFDNSFRITGYTELGVEF